MLDLTVIYNSFDVDEPLPAEDDARYVDLSNVRGQHVVKRLVQQIINAQKPSHHLLMGHTKCGKTTELNRAAHVLQKEGYLTVFFDVAEVATRTFEYTMVLLLMAHQVVEQLAKENIEVNSDHAKKLAEFLQEKEVTVGGTKSLEGKVGAEAEVGAGLLASILGKLGFGVELGGSFQRSREITTKIEVDTRGFINAIRELIKDAYDKVLETGSYKGLVIICDGCDKLAITATDGSGKSHDLQQALFVDHASDLRAVPCHVIYTVPLSIAVNLGDNWEQSPVFVPAVPVNQLPGVEDAYPKDGRDAMQRVVECRLNEKQTKVEELFADPSLLNHLIDVSGGHISDLLLLVREAVLETQIDGADKVAEVHINRSIRSRALEYTRLIESNYLDTLWNIDQHKTAQSNNDVYRAVIFKRLALEYICGNDNRVDLHPLVAATEVYRRHKEVKVNEPNK
ncbi:MAG TPA: hypothetical protein VEY11_07345 [Pyrinomonadaceae bacterium]|nr:hypothetical protein [Pyrinomonadaceae bacterium]